MTRRRVLLAVLVVASVTLAGCAGSDGGATSTPEGTTATPTSTATPTTAASSSPSPTPTPSRLVVRAHGVESVTVTLWNSSLPEGEPAYNRTFHQPDGARFLDHALASRTSYYAVVRANGTVVVNRTLHASTGYRVEVTPNGTDVATVDA